MAKKSAPTVVIMDEFPALSAGLQMLLDKFGFNVVATVDRPSSILSVVKSKKIDMVLLDTLTTGSDSLVSGEKILKESPDTKVVYFSAKCTDSMIDRAVAAGASGFISKTESPEQLELALKQILGGEKYLSAEAEKRMVKTRGIKPRSRLSTLSPRELEVLQYLAQDYSVREVAEKLGVRPTTVETHRQSLRAKLDIRGAAGMARFAIREGLIEA
ncbi:Hypothetical protein PBC10988_29330 [Planctomycetales bacterium 10988]|nr:Hypothetical protein PBC10988_29330 [Planctomycetales bacterium 10988]